MMRASTRTMTTMLTCTMAMLRTSLQSKVHAKHTPQKGGVGGCKRPRGFLVQVPPRGMARGPWAGWCMLAHHQGAGREQPGPFKIEVAGSSLDVTEVCPVEVLDELEEVYQENELRQWARSEGGEELQPLPWMLPAEQFGQEAHHKVTQAAPSNRAIGSAGSIARTGAPV